MKLQRLIIRNITSWVALLLFGCLATNPLFAQETARAEPEGSIKKSTEPSKSRIRFRPPSGDAPAARVAGGSRGKGDQQIALDVLTPDGIGLTTQEQPSLFWYQSKPSVAEFELTLLEDGEIEPLVHVKIKESANAGIQRLVLADHGAKLSPDVEYQWVVALILDPKNRSGDLVASGVIKRVAPSTELKALINDAQPADLAMIYAEAGVWYDSLAALTDQIDTHPDDAELVATRADLLEQVGLKINTSH